MMFKKEKKDSLLQIRLSEQQKSVIKDLAKKNNQSVSDFILTLVQSYYDVNN